MGLGNADWTESSDLSFAAPSLRNQQRREAGYKRLGLGGRAGTRHRPWRSEVNADTHSRCSSEDGCRRHDDLRGAGWGLLGHTWLCTDSFPTDVYIKLCSANMVFATTSLNPACCCFGASLQIPLILEAAE